MDGAAGSGSPGNKREHTTNGTVCTRAAVNYELLAKVGGKQVKRNLRGVGFLQKSNRSARELVAEEVEPRSSFCSVATEQSLRIPRDDTECATGWVEGVTPTTKGKRHPRRIPRPLPRLWPG